MKMLHRWQKILTDGIFFFSQTIRLEVLILGNIFGKFDEKILTICRVV